MNWLHSTFNKITGEHLLKTYPNGGFVIFLRSLRAAIFFYIVLIGLIGGLELLSSIGPKSVASLPKLLARHISWFGGLITIVYTTLQVRFSAQWSYLANVYNQIKQAEVRTANLKAEETQPLLAQWKAGFIEDAYTLHLVRKPLFASVICAWEKAPGVRAAFSEFGPKMNAQDNDVLWNEIIGSASKSRAGAA